MIGATLYLAGEDAKTDEQLNVTEPCAMCQRLILNAGIEKVLHFRDGQPDSTLKYYYIWRNQHADQTES